MLSRDFKEFIESLNAHGVEYLVVGGYALAAHGHPRYTGDIDIWIGRELANRNRLIAALAAFGFGNVGLSADDFDSPDAVVQLGYPPGRIDLLTGIDGVTFDACFARRQMVRIGALDLPIIHLEDFKTNKRASGRMKDLADLEALGENDAPD
ncbi:nucleotidyl transferase AbiEii/AbiGii toxin family protein [soil metagenome]